MNQDLTQSNLSITRDGVTINISGPAWLIRDVYDRETGNPIRVEQATPEAKAIPAEWPVFKIGDRVRYAGTDRLGAIKANDQGPRIYLVLWDGGVLCTHVGYMLDKVEDEPKAEPTIEALAQQEPESRRRRGIKNYWARLTPEERKERTEKMRAARHPNKVLATNAEQTIEPLAQQEPKTSTQPKRRGGRVSKRVPVVMRNGRQIVYKTIEQLQVGQWCEVRCHRDTPCAYANTFGYKVSSRKVRKGVQRVERVQ